MKKIGIVVLLCIGFLISCFPVAAQSVTAENSNGSNGFELICTNNRMRLWAVTSGSEAGQFYVEDTNTGARWYSNPQDIPEEQRTNSMSSQFLFQQYNSKTGSVSSQNSFKATDDGEYIKVSKKANGFKTNYNLINGATKFTLTVELENDELVASFDAGDIEYSGSTYITEVSLLPYFGSTAYNSDGYTLVPDGCGAIIDHTPSDVTGASYSQQLYGIDITFAPEVKATKEETALLPVFGMKADRGSILGIVEDGAFSASINAEKAANDMALNTVYTSFRLIGKDSIKLGENGIGMNQINDTYDMERMLADKCSVRYCFLDVGSGYAEMAKKYRKYLGIQPAEQISVTPTLFLEAYGGVNRKESFLGIPCTRFKQLTSVKELQEMIEYFDKGIASDIRCVYRNCDQSVLNGKIQNKLSPIKRIASKKSLAALAQQLNGRLYLEHDIYAARKSGNGFFRFTQTSVRISKESVINYRYDPSTTNINTKLGFGYAIQPEKLSGIVSGYLKSVKNAGLNTAFINAGNSSYSDFNTKKYISRKETAEILAETVNSSGASSLLYAPAAYMLGSGAAVSDTPMKSSGFDSELADVPFYQLVISGVKEYSLESVNMRSDAEFSFLRAIEFGASLKFTLCYGDTTEIVGTEYENLCGTQYEKWKTTISEMQNHLEDLRAQIGCSEIVDHEILSESVRRTVYSNGNAVLVNYSNKPVETEYGTVEAMSWLVSLKQELSK